MTSYNKTDPQTIQTMFGSIAKDYDFTNAVLSFQLHRYWNRRLVMEVEGYEGPLLDLCCGTGDIAIAFLKRQLKTQTAYLLDFCPEMLAIAQSKADNAHDIHYIEGDAQAIPLPDNSVGCITIAYGIRNVKDPQKCFDEAWRVLKPGGVFSILELTRPRNRFLRFGHSLYLKTVLPILGKLITTNREAYRYLCSSIKTFLSPNDLSHMLTTSGFSHIEEIPLSLGIATIITTVKVVPS